VKHLGTKTIETERLILRRFQMVMQGHVSKLGERSEVTRFLTWPAHPSIEVSKVVIAGWMERYSELDYYQWAIALKPTRQASSVDRRYAYKTTMWKGGNRILHRAEILAAGNHVGGLKALIEFFHKRSRREPRRSQTRSKQSELGNVMKKCGSGTRGP
jgi:ribosomal-protein-alanine N-acetyltransferase